MTIMILGEVLIVLLLILANGFFAGAEIAIVALRKARIQELADEGRRGAAAALALRARPERFLATVQIGITVVGATAAAFGGASLAGHLAPYLAQGAWLSQHAYGLAFGLVVAAVSYLSIVVGELVPKSLALRASERYAMLASRPLLGLSFLARPLVWFLSASANVLLKPFRDQTTFTETRHSTAELQELVEEAAQSGSIHPEAAEIASRALELPELTVADVMVPRGEVVAIARNASPEELRRTLLEHTRTRLPVYDGVLDNVTGYVNTKDLLALAWDHRLIILEDVIRSPFFVPESKLGVELLREMRARHLPFAIVVDEHGGMSGIVTMEDLLEELVGEMFSEHEHEDVLVRRDADGTWLLRGSASIRKVNRLLEQDLPNDGVPDDGPWSTIAGLVLALAGRMPRAKEVLRLPNGVELEVTDASERRIRSVRLRPPKAASARVS